MTHLLPYITDKLEGLHLRHEIHRFDSGAIIVDIWIQDKFHVIQIEDKTIGISLITKDDSPFDTIPDISFSEEPEFKIAFEKILLAY
jgi:uncharacterized protein (UPF0128 family)